MKDFKEFDFKELASLRKELQDKCKKKHYDDLWHFQEGLGFEEFSPEDNSTDEEAKNKINNNLHKSITATCIESLMEIPDMLLPDNSENKLQINDLKNKYVEKVLELNWEEIDETDSTGIYDRCRVLPLIIITKKEFIEPNDPKHTKIQDLISYILLQMKQDKKRKAIGEVKYDGKRNDYWYPENAYHTFYTLKTIELFSDIAEKNEEGELIIRDRLNNNGKVDETKVDETRKEEIIISEKKTELIDWSIEFLAKQIAYHDTDSSFKDSDQLAWILAILTRFNKENLKADLSSRDLIEKGFDCLFKVQRPDGSWIAGKPLFHKNAGDAHCYMFETLSEIIKNALQKKNEFLRKILKKYYKNLKNVINYAEKTCIYEKDYCLWSSGHQINKPYPESWATASVYSFYQQMRKLIGYWTKNEVINNLKKPNINIARPNDPLKKIVERGSVWQFNGNLIQPNEHIMTSFVNPILLKKNKKREQEEEIEPEKYVISKNQSRSAILFGPPGTSKTFLVQVLADAIEWEYIEIHANDFLSEGLNNIHKKADEIFNQLMELDETVILFDEIDELVRSRENKNGNDNFGRFLTTSMLPKLAELWKQRKVLFFVATNYLNDFDSAITRGQRFDSLIFIPPPSFTAKQDRLNEILKEISNSEGDSDSLSCEIDNKIKIDINNIIEVIENIDPDDEDKNLEQAIDKSDLSLVKYVLIRYDQLPFLAKELYEQIKKENEKQKIINKELLIKSLNSFADPGEKWSLLMKQFIKVKNRSQINYGHVTVWEVDISEKVDISEVDKKTLLPEENFIDQEKDEFKAGILVKTKSNKSSDKEKYWYITPYPIDDNFLTMNKLEKDETLVKLVYKEDSILPVRNKK